MEIDTERIEIKINTTHTDKPGSKQYESKGPIKNRPLKNIVRAFLHSNEIKGTIHRICVKYVK